MVATVTVQEINGSTPTYSSLTSARYCTIDSAIPGSANSLPIPSSGSINFSFWKHHILLITGTFTRVENIRWYTDGTVGWNIGTSGKFYVGCRTSGDSGASTSNAYYQASGTVGTTGISIIASSGAGGHQFYNGQTSGMRLASLFTTGNPLTIDTNGYVAANAKSKAVVTQVTVDDDATAGTQTAETVTFRYDEI